MMRVWLDPEAHRLCFHRGDGTKTTVRVSLVLIAKHWADLSDGEALELVEKPTLPVIR
jgi:hypothetical protein